MAQATFAHLVGPGSALVSSAGTDALLGEPMHAGCASALRRLGVPPVPHGARQFTPDMATVADLVLTAERGHRDQIIELAPTAHGRTFTLREFLRLSRHVGIGPAAQVATACSSIRGVDGPVPAALDDVIDPFGLTEAAIDTVTADIVNLVTSLVTTIGLAPRRRPRPHRRPLPR